MGKTKISMNKSEIARKIVEYFNRDEMGESKWDSFMYQQKNDVLDILNELPETPPCKFDHNGECLLCDCWPDSCVWERLKTKD
jgi:uncharacterized protein YdeI (YjbR/CyaY-like superfamily)